MVHTAESCHFSDHMCFFCLRYFSGLLAGFLNSVLFLCKHLSNRSQSEIFRDKFNSIIPCFPTACCLPITHRLRPPAYGPVCTLVLAPNSHLISLLSFPCLLRSKNSGLFCPGKHIGSWFRVLVLSVLYPWCILPSHLGMSCHLDFRLNVTHIESILFSS